MLEQQPAARGEMGTRRRNNRTDRIQPIGTGNERLRGLIGERREVRIADGDIRWIGDDELMALRAERLAPAAVPPIDVEAIAHRIALRHRERCRARLDRDYARLWPRMLDGERDCAASGAE